MALKVGELYGLLGLDDGPFNRGLGNAEKKFRGFGDNLIGIGSQIAPQVFGAFAVSGVVGLGAAALKAAGDLEQTNIAFSSLLGSERAATKFVNDLRAFAANTPFELPGLLSSSRMLLAFGFQARDVIPLLTSIGNAASAMGSGAEGIDRITRAIGQMKAKGKVQAEELLQLAEIGIPAWEMLAKKLGVSIPEAMKRVSDGAVDAATGIKALQEGMDQRFSGMMEKQSKTFLGIFSTLKDNATNLLADIGMQMLPVFNNLINYGTFVVMKFREMTTSSKELFTSLTTIFAVGGPIVVGTALLAGLGKMVLWAGQTLWWVASSAIPGAVKGVFSLVRAVWQVVGAIMAWDATQLPTVILNFWRTVTSAISGVVKFATTVYGLAEAFFLLASAEGLAAALEAAFDPTAALRMAAAVVVVGGAMYGVYKASKWAWDSLKTSTQKSLGEIQRSVDSYVNQSVKPPTIPAPKVEDAPQMPDLTGLGNGKEVKGSSLVDVLAQVALKALQVEKDWLEKSVALHENRKNLLAQVTRSIIQNVYGETASRQYNLALEKRDAILQARELYKNRSELNTVLGAIDKNYDTQMKALHQEQMNRTQEEIAKEQERVRSRMGWAQGGADVWKRAMDESLQDAFAPRAMSQVKQEADPRLLETLLKIAELNDQELKVLKLKLDRFGVSSYG